MFSSIYPQPVAKVRPSLRRPTPPRRPSASPRTSRSSSDPIVQPTAISSWATWRPPSTHSCLRVPPLPHRPSDWGHSEPRQGPRALQGGGSVREVRAAVGRRPRPSAAVPGRVLRLPGGQTEPNQRSCPLNAGAGPLHRGSEPSPRRRHRLPHAGAQTLPRGRLQRGQVSPQNSTT